jgi:transposase InsO family protein
VTSGIFTDVCKILKIEKLHTTAYNPRANGLVERFNQTLGNALKKTADGDLENQDYQLISLLKIQKKVMFMMLKIIGNY